MRIAIRHTIELTVGEGIPRAVQHLLLTPQSSSVQSVADWRIEAPGMDEVDGFIDAYGNRAHLSSQTRPEPSFAIVASGMVETQDRNGVVGRLERDPVPALFRRTTALTRPAAAIVNRFRGMPKDGSERIGLLHALMARVAEVAGEPAPPQAQTQTQGTLTQSQTAGAAPTAPDHAHAFIGAARALGIPARYVTGYLVREDGEGAAFHAWAEAWDDRLGWIGFDATLGLCPTERHVRLAVGLDALTTQPVRSVPAASPPGPGTVTLEAQAA